MIHPERLQQLNNKPIGGGRYVLYWMQASQRAEDNHALEHAIQLANEVDQPLLAYFELVDDYPDANARHYAFMLQGLAETAEALKKRGIKLCIRYRSLGAPPLVTIARNASALVADAGYTRMQKQWRAQVADAVPCYTVQAETDVIVPVESVTDKEEYAARTIRPKIEHRLDEFLQPVRKQKLRNPSLKMRVKTLPFRSPDAVYDKLRVNRSVWPSRRYIGGASEASHRLRAFIRNTLPTYHTDKNDPSLDAVSHLSPYLHFGQVSPLTIALKLKGNRGAGAKSFLEELIIRRELAMNFVHFNKKYDSFSGLPDWSQKTLKQHANDKRQPIYSMAQLEQAQTHDDYWNAAQQQMVMTGHMHGYMRMYWGKKIIEWSKTPQTAFRRALELNNKYELDGRDPNGFTGVAWCFGKHDTPFPGRPIFGTVRYMSANGLRRKFNMEEYIRQINELS